MDKQIDVLLVEDNEDHIYLTRKALSEGAGAQMKLHIVTDGEAALDFMNHRAPYEGVPSPDLVLLDVKLPKKDGFEVLEALKTDPRFRAIPVIMLTSSDTESDILRGYGLGSNAYIAKPIAFDEFSQKLRAIPEFWNRIATLPAKKVP